RASIPPLAGRGASSPSPPGIAGGPLATAAALPPRRSARPPAHRQPAAVPRAAWPDNHRIGSPYLPHCPGRSRCRRNRSSAISSRLQFLAGTVLDVEHDDILIADG